MSDFVKALEAKIRALRKEQEQHLAAAAEIDSKLGVLEELLLEEGGEIATPTSPAPKKRRPGRPRGSKTKKKAAVPPPDDDVVQEAGDMEGTDPALAKKLASRPFRPAPRDAQWAFGPGIKAGRPEDTAKGKTTVPGRDVKDITLREPEEDNEDG